jgi:hypothetical protein
VYPQNDSQLVEKLGALLGADLDQVFALKAIEGLFVSV